MKTVAILLGNNLYVGQPVLLVFIKDKWVDFFKLREIHRVRSNGSYMTIDCDIKDKDNVREIKIEKSIPRVIPKNVTTHYNHKLTYALREDGSTIIRIEQLEDDNPAIPTDGRILDILKQLKIEIEAYIKITGDFYAGDIHIIMDDSGLVCNGVTQSNCFKQGKIGLKLSSHGFAF